MDGGLPALLNPLQRLRGTGFEFGRRLNLRITHTEQAVAAKSDLKGFVKSLLKEDDAAVSFIERSRSRGSYAASQLEKISEQNGDRKDDEPTGLEKMLGEFKDLIDKLYELGDPPATGNDPGAKEREAIFNRLGELANDDSVKGALELLSGFEERLSSGKASIEDILNEAAQHDDLFGKGFLRSIKNGEVGAIKQITDMLRSVTSPDFTSENIDKDQLEVISSQVDSALVTAKGVFSKPEEHSVIEGGLDGLIAMIKRLKKLMKEKGDSLESPEVRKALDDEIVKTNSALQTTLKSPNFQEFIKLVSGYQQALERPQSNAKVIGDLLDKDRWLVGSRVPELFRKGQSWDIKNLITTFGKLADLQITSETANPEALDGIINSLRDAKRLVKGEKKHIDIDAIVKKASALRQAIDQVKAKVIEINSSIALGIKDDVDKALGAHSGLAGERAAFLLVIDDQK